MKKIKPYKKQAAKPGTQKTKPTTSSGNNKPSYYLKPGKKFMWISLFLMILITFIAYSPSLRNTFTNWDDESYVTDNMTYKKVSLETMKDLFIGKNKFQAGNYHPLTMISHAIDYQLGKIKIFRDFGKKMRKNEIVVKKYKDEPIVSIMNNIFLHLFNCLLLFWLIYRLSDKFWLSMITAALFALNPMHVESVSWIAERKDLLYTFFFLVSLIFYVKFVNVKSRSLYILSLLFFIFSLFSKGQAVTLSLCLILIDYFKGRKLKSREVILEKLPFFALSLIFGIVAIIAQHSSEAIQEIGRYGMGTKALFAANNFTEYLLRLAVPVNLAAIHPYPPGNLPISGKFYLNALLCLVFFVLFIFAILKHKKEAVFGMGFYLVNIFLLLQILAVGGAIMAERYTYVSSIGFSFIIGSGFCQIIEKKQKLAPLVFSAMLVYLTTLSVLTYGQTKVWRNSYTLMSNTVIRHPDSVMGLLNLGSAERDMGHFSEAVDHLNAAASMLKTFPMLFITRGGALRELGRNKEAVEDFTQAILLKPKRYWLAQSYHSRGVSEFKLGMMQEALHDYNLSIQLDTTRAEFYINRARLFGNINHTDSAIIDASKAVRLEPENGEYIGTKGAIHYLRREYEKALTDYNTALKIDPTNPTAYLNRGILMIDRKEYKAAIEDFTNALQIQPSLSEAYLNRALCKKNLNDFENSVNDYNMAISLNPNFGLAYFQRALLNIQRKKFISVCSDLKLAMNLGVGGCEPYISNYCK